MGRLRSEQRQLEVELMRFCHNKLGAIACLMQSDCADSYRATPVSSDM